jgi:putative peptidoglycan lipid II flippase
MLPGIAVLGLNQINQLITSRFASFLGDGGVTAQFYAYRVTELMYGGLIVQLTTVLLPVLSRELRERPSTAPTILTDTIRLVSFVTLPSAVVLLVAARPVIGLLFGGGAFDGDAVELTARTLAFYAFGLVGTAHAKVMASAYFAQGNTRTPMVGTAVTLCVFTAAAALLVGPLGVPGLGLANTIAMTVYAAMLTIDYGRRYELRSSGSRSLLIPVGRQAVASLAMGSGLWWAGGWLTTVTSTGLAEALRVGVVFGAAGVVYVMLVALTGGREPRAMLEAVRRRRAA